MSARLGPQAGSAMSWQSVLHFGVQGIMLLRLLVLARLLAPADFGLQAIALLSVSLLLRLTELGMAPALIQRAVVEPRHYHAAWTVGLLRAVGVATVVFFAAPLFGLAFAEPRATPLVRAAALLPLLQAAASIKIAELTRELRFRGLAGLRLSEAVATTLVSIALAQRLGAWALILGTLAGAAVFAALSYFVAPYRPRLELDLDALVPLVRFGRWIFARSLVALAGQSILELAISRRLGVAELGLYFLAARLAFLPSTAASAIVGTVAFPMYSRLQDNVERAAGAFRTQVLGTAALLLPVYALILALAPSLTEELLGPRWIGSAPVIRILALASLVGLLGDIVDPILNAFGRPAAVTLIEVVQSAVLISSVWLLAGAYGLPGAAASWLPAIAVSQVLSVVLLRQLFERPFRGIGAALLFLVGAAVAGGWVAWWLDRTIEGVVGVLVAAAAGAGLIGVGLLVGERVLGFGLGVAAVQLFPRLASVLERMRVLPVRDGAESDS